MVPCCLKHIEKVQKVWVSHSHMAVLWLYLQEHPQTFDKVLLGQFLELEGI